MISKRLKILTEYVNGNDKVGDIGTDHGFIPIHLLENNIVKYIIASDLNEGPLENAKTELISKGLIDFVDLRLGSGLVPYTPGEIDVAIIAGMGGTLMTKILEDGKAHIEYLNKLILQPMKGVYHLREWLLTNGYEIVDEQIMKEKNIFYEIIVAEKGISQEYTKKELEFGFTMLKKDDEVSLEFLDEKINKVKQIVDDIEKNGGSFSAVKKENFKEKLKYYKEVKACL